MALSELLTKTVDQLKIGALNTSRKDVKINDLLKEPIADVHLNLDDAVRVTLTV